MYYKISNCRLCGNTKLKKLFSLGEQFLSGVFLKTEDQLITKGPLSLVKCFGDNDSCGLVQLEHTFNSDEMFGDNYGYRSSLNITMVKHLNSNINKLSKYVKIESGDIVVDIGSNDGTTLKAYANTDITKIGYDLSGESLRKYYTNEVILVSDSFSSVEFKLKYNKKIKIITCFAMFYDLNDPLQFINELTENLMTEGVLMFEMSYLYSMIDNNAYDTICHEHVCYYSLTQINWIAEKNDLKIIDFGFNNINGGSFYVILTKITSQNLY